eukprot:7075136-Alexandrium_andersonii.AAC.1
MSWRRAPRLDGWPQRHCTRPATLQARPRRPARPRLHLLAQPCANIKSEPRGLGVTWQQGRRREQPETPETKGSAMLVSARASWRC